MCTQHSLAAAVSDDDDKNETCNKFVSVILLQCKDKNATSLNNIIFDLHENVFFSHFNFIIFLLFYGLLI